MLTEIHLKKSVIELVNIQPDLTANSHIFDKVANFYEFVKIVCILRGSKFVGIRTKDHT